MENSGIEATAWKGGQYGLKVNKRDQDRFLKREWRTINLRLPNGCDFEVNIDKESFWNGTCRELISKNIGDWLIQEGLAPWDKGSPPKFLLKTIGARLFEVVRA